ncbi:MAG: metallophosphoesterase [Bacteroidia bacterium]|nr:metallophosphoesterase [Bacteroidia bacterium]
MKKTASSVFLFLVIASFFAVKAQYAGIGVISDLHYTHPALIVEKGKALDDYLQRDRKLLLESDALLRKSVENLLSENVNIVLIPGDLTKDGELISHRGVTELLQPLREKGVKVLVIPGNHDIDNPDAVSFHGDEIRKVQSITPPQFKEIYKDFGYGNAISADEHSLSYVSEPVEGLRIICIDACKYYNNTFVSRGATSDSCVTHGAVKPETMRWIKTEAQVAKLLGKQVIAMMHHGVVEQSFMDAGLNVVFTGHFHASDIAKIEDDKGNYLYDVETGSIVTYPCPYRIINISENQLHINTLLIEDIDYPLPAGMSFQAYAEKMVDVGFNEMVSALIHEYHESLPAYLPGWLRQIVRIPDAEKFTDIVLSNLSPSAVKMLVAHYGGNENQVESAHRNKDEILLSINNFVRELCQESLGRFPGGIAQNLILRSNTLKKTKLAVSSIWENAALYSDNSIDDLNYLLTLNPNHPINNGNFYANEEVNDEVKAKLFPENSDNEEEQSVLPENKTAVINRQRTLVTE